MATSFIRKTAAGFLVGFALIDVGLSVLVGFVGAPKGAQFDWGLAAAVGTAVGTTLLAVVTGLLAYTTSRDVSATPEIARLTKEDLDARDRPVVIVDPKIRAGESKVPVVVTNVGLGPALGVYVTARYDVEGVKPPKILPVMFSVIPPGEWRENEIEAHFDPPPPGGIEPAWIISGSYTDRRFAERYEVITDLPTRVLTMPGIELGDVPIHVRPHSNPIVDVTGSEWRQEPS